jgi:5-carboxymethyl-2-hydroxymuconate isomerase
MPHLILEYSANLPAPDLQGLFAALHDALATLGFEVDDCKTRAHRCEAFRVGTGAPDRAFAHLTVAVLDRRTRQTQRAAGELALQRLRDAFGAAALDCDLTVEVREMRAGSYFKARAPRARTQ